MNIEYKEIKNWVRTKLCSVLNEFQKQYLDICT